METNRENAASEGKGRESMGSGTGQDAAGSADLEKGQDEGMSFNGKRFGELLMEAGVITPDDLKKALKHQSESGERLGEALVNLSLAREEDIVEALKSGKLAGFATDVWPSDPPKERTAIFDAPNTVFSPHLGASTKENMLRIGMIIDRLIGDFVEHKS